MFQAVLTGARNQLKKPLRRQLGDLAEQLGDAMASPSTYVPSGGALGRGTRLAGDAAEAAADATKLGKTATKAAKAIDNAGHAVADVATGERRAARAAHVAEQAQRGVIKHERSPYLVTPRGTTLPPDKDYNLVSDDPRKWLQIHGDHDHQPYGRPHTHAPEVHRRPDGTAGSIERIDRATTAEDIDYADQALKSGEFRLRSKGRR